ncbi:melanocortin-2 receptor accessory protein 2A-like isoform X1 [Chelmon rostratus]|uniref:melanocortin-2 receptor accessory protein 2A-like isoform X1 n=2 Tax=Chelmon rostratus TaxID=109905 RepID=UPI001BEAD09F|nr:melanocortin-2 receptor accessory protein 2A-like isoform X1 [Chelmon rostratus]XP_041814994.1 melanocortin-2 receptor accessory protein 2A-like isoform X1 [Chelmon rostratus]
MSDFHNRSQTSARRSDYVWQYEYYDDEEPVSFEGLKAHRYSIVIGFWVGLAVFVIFMFFVLTLLTKTGAPHQENPDSAEKRHRPGSCLVDIDGPQDENDKAFSRPLLAGSRSYFHFYINEEDQGQGKQKAEDEGVGKHSGAQAQKATCSRTRGISSSGMDDMEEDVEEAGEHQPLKGLIEESKPERECAFFSHFNIPNFVNLEHSSTLGEDDLLCEPSVILERHSHSQDAHCDIR